MKTYTNSPWPVQLRQKNHQIVTRNVRILIHQESNRSNKQINARYKHIVDVMLSQWKFYGILCVNKNKKISFAQHHIDNF